jgi:alpha,alpha-trehalase
MVVSSAGRGDLLSLLTGEIIAETTEWCDMEPVSPRPTPLAVVDACVLDTDGVITRTADAHRDAWKQLFDTYLDERFAGSPAHDPEHRPFDEEDYLAYVDGRPRYDGVDAFLRSRGIVLELGQPDDPPQRDTVCGLGNRKNVFFRAHLDHHGVAAYDSTVALVRRMRDLGIGVAAVSASENQAAVLVAAGLSDLFDVRVDGIMARDLGLAGKPDPALFLEAARRLGVPPARAAVVEDARSGVEAGRRGGFGAVIGVDRSGHPAELQEAGADVVVADLCQVHVDDERCLLIEPDGPGDERPLVAAGPGHP